MYTKPAAAKMSVRTKVELSVFLEQLAMKNIRNTEEYTTLIKLSHEFIELAEAQNMSMAVAIHHEVWDGIELECEK